MTAHRNTDPTTHESTSKDIKDAIERGIADAQAQGNPEWLGATDALLELLIERRECFSSGEIAAHLRTFRPDLVFSVTNDIGDHVRNRFWGDTMPLYPNDDGSYTPVEQVPRRTGGFTRTPPGTEVFVYGPDHQAASDHEFEVDIPKPGTQVPADPADADGLPAKPKQAPAPVQHFTQLTPRPHDNLRATVHNDARCCIPRSAVEALLHEADVGLKGGDSLYVLVDDDAEEVRVGLDREDGAQGYQLSASRGRVLFPHPVRPFKAGDSFRIRVEGDERRMVVDLSVAL